MVGSWGAGILENDHVMDWYYVLLKVIPSQITIVIPGKAAYTARGLNTKAGIKKNNPWTPIVGKTIQRRNRNYMPNPEHLARLLEGVEAWDEWRKSNSDVIPDLAGADLTDANLEGANLEGAILRAAKLIGTSLGRAFLFQADLSGAVLRLAFLGGANLGFANLTKADLTTAKCYATTFTQATLSGARLIGATLRGANFLAANLSGANFSKADLEGANFTKADLANTNFKDANLTNSILCRTDLSKANFAGAILTKADLEFAILNDAKLSGSDLREANLEKTRLTGVDLSGANLSGLNLSRLNLSKADFVNSNLGCADLMKSNLCGANLSGADLQLATLVESNLNKANLSGCKIYGASVWNADMTGSIQKDLVITRDNEPIITVDSLEFAQFIYLLLNNKKIRDAINIVANKVVLILGRFTEPRMAVLKEVKDKLRSMNYLPVLFDFEKPNDRDFTETIRTLAHLSKFIIADISSPKSVPQELQAIVPDLHVPVIPIIKKGQKPWGMFSDQRKHLWVLKVHKYRVVTELLEALERDLIPAALERPQKLEEFRNQLDS